MTVKITLQPSGHTFTAEPHEPILEAALRVGLPLRYHCNNGTCGECKARVVRGKLGECRFYDYVFSEAEKLQGHTLLCCASAETDMVIDACEATSTRDIPEQQFTAKVSKVERLTDEVILLHVRTPRSQTLWFIAGQSIDLQIGSLPAARLPIASCPCNGMQLQLHVHKNPDDPFAEYCFQQLNAQHSVILQGPWGDFILDEESQRPVIFIAGEAGFGAIKSIIEHAIALEMPQRIHLYWIVEHQGSHYLQNYCRSWVDALDDYHFTPLVLQPKDGANAVEGDELEQAQAQVAQVIAQDYPDLSTMDVYLSGTERTTEYLIPLLLKQGLPAARLFLNAYE